MEFEPRENYMQALPDEILVKIFQCFSIRNLPSLCGTCKTFNNILDWNMKVKMADDYLKSRKLSRPKEALKVIERFARGLIKAVLDLDSPNHLKYFVKLVSPKNSIADALVKLIKQTPHTYKIKSTQKTPYNNQFIFDMVDRGLNNVLGWFIQEWETIIPDIRQRMHNQQFQIYWLRLLAALYKNHSAGTSSNEFLRIKPLIFEQLEIYSDMLVRLLVTDISSLSIGGSVVPLTLLLEKHSKVDYLQFLDKLRTESNLKIDFFNVSPYHIEEQLAYSQLPFQKAMMLTPIEASFYLNGASEQMLEIVPKEKYGAILAALFCRADPPDRDVPQLIQLGADVNALLPKQFSKFLYQEDVICTIESALGSSVFNSKTRRHWRIEWLLSNGAKFSESEVASVHSRNNQMFNKILAASLKPSYNMLLNQYEDPPANLIGRGDITYYSPEGKISFRASKFRFERNPRRIYVGNYSIVGSKIISTSVTEHVEFSRNSYSSSTDIISCYEVFNFIIYRTAFDGVAFELLQNRQMPAAYTDVKSYLPFFEMYWDFGFAERC